MIYRIAFMGPPGSGKGTQAMRLAPVLGIPIIGPGALYRKEIAANTELGMQVRDIVASGALVPHAITNAIIVKRLREPDCANGYILDGYPREREQQDALDRIVPPLTHAILLHIPEAEVVHRLADRLVCICGQQFNRRELGIDPGDEARCMACEGVLERRKDDNPETIQKRIDHYHAQTEPVIAAYRERGIVMEIDGNRPIDIVHHDLLAKLGIAVA